MKAEQVEFGWRKLEAALNKLIDAINANEPLEGSGVMIEDMSGGGKMISVSRKGKPQPGTPGTQGDGGDGVQGVLLQVLAIDPATGNLGLLNVYTDGNGFTGEQNTWRPVTLVDPASCAQSQATFLGKPT